MPSKRRDVGFICRTTVLLYGTGCFVNDVKRSENICSTSSVNWLADYSHCLYEYKVSQLSKFIAALTTTCLSSSFAWYKLKNLRCTLTAMKISADSNDFLYIFITFAFQLGKFIKNLFITFLLGINWHSGPRGMHIQISLRLKRPYSFRQ